MFPCVYTTQKTKKSKKWMDGYVMIAGRKIVLFNEDKTIIFSAVQYTINDDTIETSKYLIFLDFLDCLLASREPVVSSTATSPCTTEGGPPESASLASAPPSTPKPPAIYKPRSDTDVMDLWTTPRKQ